MWIRGDREWAMGQPMTPARVAFPEILSSEDAGLYGRIFDVQEQGDWKQADRLIGRLVLQDMVLQST